MNYLLGQMQQLGYLTRDDDPGTSASSAYASPREDTPRRGRSATSSPRSKRNWNRSSDRHSSTTAPTPDPAQRHPLRPRSAPTTSSNGPTTTPARRLDRSVIEPAPRPRARSAIQASVTTEAALASAADGEEHCDREDDRVPHRVPGDRRERRSPFAHCGSGTGNLNRRHSTVGAVARASAALGRTRYAGRVRQRGQPEGETFN